MREIKKECINGIDFKLSEIADLSFLSSIGKAFCVFDQNDSGNISFGFQNEENQRFFVKIAGLQTCNMEITKEVAVQTLKDAIDTYHQLADSQLIHLVDSFSYEGLFIAIFEWFDGECLFDHWNFDFYEANPNIISPINKFRQLDMQQKIEFSNAIFSFLEKVDTKQYAAIDFYDSSIIYNFKTHQFKVCDIDLFKQMPTYNTMGTDFWGTKRMKSPEEYLLNHSIDSRTNVFKAGAFFMNLFGTYTSEQLSEMYQFNQFIPVSFKQFTLPYNLYQILLKSVHPEKEQRYQSISEMKIDWFNAQKNIRNFFISS